ncbi:MAG: hypothetical protein JNL57_12930 [Bacteroidetes bacterium]|nr:hypothetical protein [Bacteroidota bacterium]
MRNRPFLYALLILALPAVAFGQRRISTKRSLDISVGPAAGYRFLTAVEIPGDYRGLKTDFMDSLRKADRPGQTLNFYAQFVKQKNAFQAISFGLGYTTLGFRRVWDNIKVGDEIHKDLGVVANFVQAGPLAARYEYRYRYIEAAILWHWNAAGYQKLKDVELWYVGGFAPAFLWRDKMGIRTQGFQLEELSTGEIKNTFQVTDHGNTGIKPNVFLHGALRCDVNMFKSMHALLQPHLRVPLLPSSRGYQSAWIPQFGVDLGLVIKLNQEKEK